MKKIIYLTAIAVIAFCGITRVEAQTKKAGASNSKFAFQVLPGDISSITQSPTDVYFVQKKSYSSNEIGNTVFALNKTSGKLCELIAGRSGGSDFDQRPAITSVAWHPTLGLLLYLEKKGMYAYDNKSVETSPLLYQYNDRSNNTIEKGLITVAPDSTIILYSYDNYTLVINPDGKTLRYNIKTAANDYPPQPLSGNRYAVRAHGTDVHLFEGEKLVAKYRFYTSEQPESPEEVFRAEGHCNDLLASQSGDSLLVVGGKNIFLQEKGSPRWTMVRKADGYSFRFLIQSPRGDFAIVPGGYDDRECFVFLGKDLASAGSDGKAITTDIVDPKAAGMAEPYKFSTKSSSAYFLRPLVDQYGNYYVLHEKKYPDITDVYIYNPNGIKGLEAIKGRRAEYTTSLLGLTSE